MVAVLMRAENVETLRQGLRRCTHALHDNLDNAIAGEARAGSEGYAAFLRVQYAARRPIEEWAAGALQPNFRPPAVSHLVAQDLAALGETPPPVESFRLVGDADPIGVAWAIGGSALGNRAMLARMRAVASASETRFLADRSLAQFFTTLLPELEEPAEPKRLHRAVQAAEAVFETFLRAVRHLNLEKAA